jgi:hypothetical protein
MNKLRNYVFPSLLILVVCNVIFSLIYVLAHWIPSESVITSLKSADQKSILKTPIYSVERSPTGAIIDFGTECVALSIGLTQNGKSKNKSQYFDRFYDGYNSSGINVGFFDPCSGLKTIIYQNSESLNNDQSSYARNWWGISILLQSLILLFGLAFTKLILYISMILSIVLFFIVLNSFPNGKRLSLLIILPFVFLSDFQDLYQSTPYSISTIALFGSANLVLLFLKRPSFSTKRFLILAITLGSIYNFIFWLNFHLVLSLIPILIFLISFRLSRIELIYKRILIFLSGYIFGFIGTTIFKWIISSLLFGSEVFDSIKFALKLRLSSGTNELSEVLLNYLAGIPSLPAPIQAILINLIMFISKFIDPRYFSLLGLSLAVLAILVLSTIVLNRYAPTKNLKLSEVVSTFPIFLIPIFYYLLTSNHSFNHAGVTYKPFVLLLSFLMGFLYLGKVRKN